MKRIVLALVMVPVMVTGPASAAVDSDPTSAACVVKGKAWFNGPLFATSGGGTPLLTLRQFERLVEAYELPADPVLGRTRIRARRESPGIRVDGYIGAKSLTYSASKEQVVITDHVSIRAGAVLKLYQSPTDLQGEPEHTPIANVRTRIECSELRFGAFGSAVEPKKDRYYFKQKSTQLFDGAGGKLVFTINLLVDPTSLVIGSTKKQGAFHLIELNDDVKVTGWVRAADIVAEKPDTGDMFGGLTGLGTSGGGYGASSIKTVKVDTDVYLAPNANGQSVGVLEKGAQVLAHPVANGFSTITLLARDAVPPDGKEFHVLTTAVQ